MTLHRLQTLLVLCATLLAAMSCSRREESQEMKVALGKAGNNRGELEDVLNHYKNDPEKLEAARWLITNMPGHFSYKGAEIDSLEEVLAPLCGYEVNINISPENLEHWGGFSYATLKREDHIRTIKADYLIKNIDHAYDMWKGRKWNSNLTFEEFCNYLLPYCLGDERLSDWREAYSDFYRAKLDSLYSGDDAVEAARTLLGIISQEGWKYNDQLSTPHREATKLLHNRVGFNRDYIDRIVYAMRACGIPVAVDMVLLSPDSYRSHMWAVVHDNVTDRNIPFGPDEMVPDRVKFPHDRRKKGKVYRVSYASQPDHIRSVKEIKSLPLRIVNPYLIDVTEEYFEQNEVAVPVTMSHKSPVYLGLLFPTEWRPIDVGVLDGDSARFRNIEAGVLYTPISVRDRVFEPCGDPFVIESGGKITILKADTMCVQKARLMRAMPFTSTVLRRLSDDVIGAVMVGDVSSDFSSPDTLFVVNDTLISRRNRYLVPDQDKEYRYLRYTAPAGRVLSVAEIELYGDKALTDTLKYKVRGEVNERQDAKFLYDGNLRSNFTIPRPGASLVIELTKPSPINTIVFTPRNDDRYVRPGNLYRLEYLDGRKGWKLIGETVAEEGKDYVEFVVPVNAFLRMFDVTDNNSGGQAFIYRKNRQFFSIDFGFFNQR